jgi:hypothetical protein
MNKDRDKLDWLREIRQKIVKKCSNDPRNMGNYFRQIQKQYENRVIENINVIKTENISQKIIA